MTAYDNTIQANAVQDRKNYHTSNHYISIGEGLRKSSNTAHKKRRARQDKKGQGSTKQYISNLHQCLCRIFQNKKTQDSIEQHKYR